MIRVSIVVPVYNTSMYLKECLDSLVNQTLQDLEIICINDGSTDNSLEILNEYADNDSRIIVVDKVNTGYGHTVNLGIHIAKGKYIGIVESDDYVLPDMFWKLYHAAEEHAAEIVKANYFEKNKDISEELIFREVLGGMPYGQVFEPKSEKDIYFKGLCIWSALYNRMFLLENGINFNETAGASYQDIAFNFKVLSCAERMYLLEEAVIVYRRDNAFSSVNNASKIFCVCDEYEEIEKFIKKRKFEKDMYLLMARLKINSYLWNYYNLASVFQYAFLLRMKEEFRDLRCEHYLLQQNWDEVVWKDINEIIDDSMNFFYRTGRDYSDFRIEKDMNTLDFQIYRHGLLAWLRESEEIWIYGAGKWAEKTIEALQREKIEIKGILVSDTKNNPTSIHGIKVYQYYSKSDLNKNTTIITAISCKCSYDIIKRLELDGYSNILALREVVWRSLGISL